MDDEEPGAKMYRLAQELFPINRSLTGEGVRQTLRRLQAELPDLEIVEVPTGTRCFDWTVPPEWNVEEAYVLDPAGERIIDFRENNLHLVGYSVPVDRVVSLDELDQHLYSLPDRPEWIPYVTSYYKERWGFCLAHQQRERLLPGEYTVRIDSRLKPGHLTYGELVLPGKSPKEILLSTYVCHPSMANNEISGPVVQTALGRWLAARDRRLSYRLVFIPETIGSIVYLSRHLKELKERVIAGYVLSCVGDERCYSYLESRLGNTLSDRVAKHVLKHIDAGYKNYSFLFRGSDERQYCSPGVDLPVGSLLRSMYGQYPEYHTSADNLDLITPAGLQGAYEAIQHCIAIIEANKRYRSKVLCEPQMSRRDLYPDLGTAAYTRDDALLMDVLAYCDGAHDLLDIAEIVDRPAWRLVEPIETLLRHGLIELEPGLE